MEISSAGLRLFLVALTTATLLAVSPPAALAKQNAVPSLDELAADWMDVRTLKNHPSVNNFSGALKTTTNLTAFEMLAFPPFSQSGSAAELTVNGRPVAADQSRWYPYQVLRRATFDGVTLESAIRMPFERQGALIRLVLTNSAKEPRILTLALRCAGHIRQFAPERWRAWDNPRPNDSLFTAASSPDHRVLTVTDKSSAAAMAYAFARVPDQILVTADEGLAQWNVTLAPGAGCALDFAVSVAGDERAAATAATEWAAKFARSFEQARQRWEERWQAAFKPGNPHFSGHLPTLITDDPAIRRVYYHGALVPLLICRTDFPAASRCFVTCGPQCANTLMYFWDTGMWADLWAMLDPTGIRELLAQWLRMDLQSCYAFDCLSGKGAGPWYAANDWSVFICVESYLNITGDASFLSRPVDGKTVLEHLERIATAYETRQGKDSPLADYGGAENLLECAPSYIHRVPSFNAANVHMLRRAAEYLAAAGKEERAAQLRAKAQKLVPAVLDLYEPGQGVWNAYHRDGKRVQLRHCLDYILIGQALENDLSPSMKTEMTAFVERELLTKSWMRAMSLQDPAAAQSVRADHGPLGSYDGWPALTMDVMCRFGQFDKAVAFMRATEAVTREGPFSQSHEFLDPGSRGADPVVRIAHGGGQDYNECCGAAFAATAIRGLFGYRPALSAGKLPLLSPSAPRGFSGQLRHVPYHGSLYTLTSGPNGASAEKEFVFRR